METVERVVIKFAGDSGDGMQLTGTQFTNTSALMGNDISTFPDFPAEIRAPAGTLAGVSGFQVQFGSTEIFTPGDAPDVLVAMNPAALKVNLVNLAKGKSIIVNEDAFNELNLKKAGYGDEVNPLDDGSLNDYQLIRAKVTSQTVEALAEIDIDSKSKARCKNFYTLGITYFMFARDIEPTIKWIDTKFGKKPELAAANIAALKAGYNYAETIEVGVSTYKVPQATIKPGRYRQVNGNQGTALGFIAAAQSAGLELFLGSYPITPATDILHELSKYKHMGVKTFQAEDEIAGICSSIGAAFAGDFAITTTSGPGLALKGEALGLAMIYELPLVVVDVQRGGPSTGLPTKTEQSDLNIAMYGRNGESPLIVIAASRPSDCFDMAYEASRLSLKHMTPVVLLTDGYIANGSDPWLIPDVEKDFPKVTHCLVDQKKPVDEPFQAYTRDENQVRPWAIPGMEGYEHRIGGLEKAHGSGNVSYDPANHAEMCRIRQEKVDMVANDIPDQEVEGNDSGDLLVVSWGGTYGSTHSAVKEMQAKGQDVTLAHIKYISPFPKNMAKVLSSYKRVIVCELNGGQMRSLINGTFNTASEGYTKMEGLPFKVSELVEKFETLLK